MTTDEKIVALLEKQGKALETLQRDLQDVKQGVTRLEQGQSRTNTVLKVLEAGQNDIRENMATKADVQEIKAEQAKQKRRIENLEETTKTPNPHRN